MRRGLYRVLGTGGRPNDVRVDDEDISVPVEEEIYRARGYQPPVDELPPAAERMLVTRRSVFHLLGAAVRAAEARGGRVRGARRFSALSDY